ncbi:MAG: DUF2752 domain-containing protein [Acidimicrobiales bacterium]|nr:DUF2752 domain-containing protein [Acidimicrobiales bacterium]
MGARALSFGLPCPLLATTGIPCPACGMTTLADTVAHGHLTEAVTTDPAGTTFLVIVGALAATYVLSRAFSWRPSTAALRWVPAALFVALAVHWLTTLITGGFVTS